jgi:hypothetical protein
MSERARPGRVKISGKWTLAELQFRRPPPHSHLYTCLTEPLSQDRPAQMEHEVDGWIEQLSQCKQLSEADVKKLCDKVRTRCRSGRRPLACQIIPSWLISPLVRHEKSSWRSLMFSLCAVPLPSVVIFTGNLCVICHIFYHLVEPLNVLCSPLSA